MYYNQTSREEKEKEYNPLMDIVLIIIAIILFTLIMKSLIKEDINISTGKDTIISTQAKK